MSVANIPGFQKIWGWRIAIFLFLASAGAGAYLMGFITGAVYSQPAITSAAIIVSLILLALGFVFMVWHLGQKTNAIAAFSRPGTSWLSRGAIALVTLFILVLIDIGLNNSPAHLIAGSIASIISIVILVYTGMLLKALKTVPFWNNILLPLLFVVSGLTTGLMAIALGSTTVAVSIAIVARYLLILIIIEAVVLFLYIALNGRSNARVSVNAIVSGHLSGYFWVGAIIMGLLIPLIIVILSGTTSAVLMLVAGIIGLIGGLLLKYVIISAGASIPLEVKGVRVPLPVAATMFVSQYIKINSPK